MIPATPTENNHYSRVTNGYKLFEKDIKSIRERNLSVKEIVKADGKDDEQRAGKFKCHYGKHGRQSVEIGEINYGCRDERSSHADSESI